MTSWEVAVAQADVTGHMILFTQAPIVKKLRVRGVLPAPHRSPAVRIALGGREADVHDLLTIYELPLLQWDELLSPWEAVSRVRHEADELRFYSGDQVDTVLGTPPDQARGGRALPGESGGPGACPADHAELPGSGR
jgi:hypothetical protein